MGDTNVDMSAVDTSEVSLEGNMQLPSTDNAEPQNGQISTLDEPVSTTIKRDLKMIGEKFFHVLVPRQSTKLLRDWDLWGPLILCMFMAIMLQSKHSLENMSSADGGPEFATFFLIYWVGALIITINTILLGGSIPVSSTVVVTWALGVTWTGAHLTKHRQYERENGYTSCQCSTVLLAATTSVDVAGQSLSIFQCMCVLGYCVVPLAGALTLCKVILLVDDESTGLFVVRSIIVLLAFAWCVFASTAFLVESQPLNRKVLVLYPIGLFYFVISWLVISHNG